MSNSVMVASLLHSITIVFILSCGCILFAHGQNRTYDFIPVDCNDPGVQAAGEVAFPFILPSLLGPPISMGSEGNKSSGTSKRKKGKNKKSRKGMIASETFNSTVPPLVFDSRYRIYGAFVKVTFPRLFLDYLRHHHHCNIFFLFSIIFWFLY